MTNPFRTTDALEVIGTVRAAVRGQTDNFLELMPVGRADRPLPGRAAAAHRARPGHPRRRAGT